MALLSTLLAGGRWPALLAFALWPAMGVAVDKTAADYYVRDLPGLPKDGPTIKMHAGHIEVNPEDNGNLFFWHFENQHIADKQRTVIWVNGGPGCSSEDGALVEIGPYRMQDNDNLRYNNASWNEFANLLFVDNPVGTGFSYVDTNKFVHELDDMANQFVGFLETWFKLFPQYEGDDIYIAGESYAGQYIPYIAKAIIERNKKAADERWNLQGLLIGNGWISPYQQYDNYIPYALEHKIFEKDSDVHKKLLAELRVCQQKLVSDPGHVDYSECERILSKMLEYTKKGTGDDACVNMYDVRLTDAWPSCGMNWPPGLESMQPYLRKPEVTKALHVNEAKNTGWQECTGAVGLAFTAEKSKPSVDYLPDILKEVPIVLFSGEQDLICNHMGTEALIDELEWNGSKGWGSTTGDQAPRRNWTFDGEDAGFWQEARNLTYILFRGSSHMVPFDMPRRSRDMLDRFMGIDVRSIGGTPVDSRLDGEQGPSTSVGDAPKPKPKEGDGKKEDVEDADSDKVTEAKWAAYQRSGEVVLVIVIIAVTCWGYFIWRERRKRAAYHALSNNDSSMRLTSSRPKSGPGDLEAAAFDESELDDMHAETPTAAGGSKHAIYDSEEDTADEKPGRSKASGSS